MYGWTTTIYGMASMAMPSVEGSVSDKALPPEDTWLPPGGPEEIAQHIIRDTPRGLSDEYYIKLIAIALRRERLAGRNDTFVMIKQRLAG